MTRNEKELTAGQYEGSPAEKMDFDEFREKVMPCSKESDVLFSGHMTEQEAWSFLNYEGMNGGWDKALLIILRYIILELRELKLSSTPTQGGGTP